MNPSDWKRTFGANRLAFLHPNDDKLPSTARAFLTEYGLPRVVIFEELHPFEISFSLLTKPLVAYNTLIQWGDFPDPALDAAWADQLVIGDEEFCNGRASHCIHRSSGIVTRVDVVISNPECFVNSDVRCYGESLLAAIVWSKERRDRVNVPSDFVSELADRIRSIDPPAFEDADNFWPNLIDVAYDNYHEFWDVSCDPAKSKPRF